MNFERSEASANRLQSEAGSSALDACFARGERTFGGRVVGALRDLASSSSSEPDSARQTRAVSNDRIVEIAADTAAFLPSFKWAGAGLLRAVLLSDPGRSLGGNGWLFGKNFIEGAALNKVGKLGAADGVLARCLSAKYGSGLAAETITHLTVGAGMGAVKTGFNQRAWTDRSGEFSLSLGLEGMVKNAGIAALTNLPAGFISSRISRGAAASAADGRISERAANLIAGWGSGYASGSVFGGIDAFVAGKGLTATLASMHEGGLVGGFTGAFVHGYESNRLPRVSQVHLSASDRLECRSNQNGEQWAVGRPQARVDAVAEPRVAKLSTSQIEQHLKMAIVPERDIPLEKLTNRLSYHTSKEPMSYERPTLKTSFQNWEDFAASALVTRETATRVYRADTLATEIVVPEAYARKLDSVRALRLQAEQKVSDRSTTDELVRIARAKVALQSDPYSNRMLPEDFIPLLEALPERNLVKRLVLLDDRNPQDRWFKQIYRENFDSAASAGENGVVTFYLKERDRPGTEWLGRGEMGHEWSHLLKSKLSPESKLFDLACTIESPESGGYFSRDYARAVLVADRPHEENWAVHLGERFLHTDADIFSASVEQMPVRAVVMARALSRSLIKVQETERSPYHAQYWERVSFVEKNILPRAQQLLVESATGGAPAVRLNAIKLLGSFGNESHTGILKQVACEANDPQLAGAAYESVVKLPRSREDRINLLVELAQRSSRIQAQALKDLGEISPQYAAFAKVLAAAGGSNDMIKLIDRMSDLQGRRLAISEALRLSKESGSVTSLQQLMQKDSLPVAIRQEAFDSAMLLLKSKPDQKVAISLNVLALHPELRVGALDQLKAYPVPEIAGRVQRFINDSNPEVARRAEQIVRGERQNSQFNSLLAGLDLGSPAEKIAAARALGALKELRSVRPLLRSAATGEARLAAEVAQALRGFAPELVKFEARELSRSSPELGARLREMLYGAQRH